MTFKPFTGQPSDLPLANLTLSVGHKMLDLEVAVLDDLKYDALLGEDVTFLWILRRKQAMAVHKGTDTGIRRDDEMAGGAM